MYKIEMQYWDHTQQKWRKNKHKLYESEKAFKIYWKHHEEYNSYQRMVIPGRRIVGFCDNKEICVYP